MRIPILSYSLFDYSFLNKNASVEVVIAKAIPIAPYRGVSGEVRVHGTQMNGGSYTFKAFGVDPSRADGRDFVSSALSTANAIDMNTTVPSLVQLPEVVDCQFPFLRITLSAVQGLFGDQPLFAQLSMDLVATQED